MCCVDGMVEKTMREATSHGFELQCMYIYRAHVYNVGANTRSRYKLTKGEAATLASAGSGSIQVLLKMKFSKYKNRCMDMQS